MNSAELKKAALAGPGRTDFYALVGLEPRFEVNLEELESRYLERSKQVHPDRFINAEPRERVQALQHALALNQAYKTLKRPMARAEYLLAHHGVSIGDNEVLDPAFLMEVLELREELAEAKAARATDKLRALEKTMLGRRNEALAHVAERFAAFEQSGKRELLEDIKKRVILLRYIQRYLEEFEDDLDEGSEP